VERILDGRGRGKEKEKRKERRDRMGNKKEGSDG
jgi:hypothetical protein